MLLKIGWILLSFGLGALPFSVWVGRLALRTNITDFGDQNPGATNVLRAGGKLWFVVALMLDISKAAAPVGLAYQIFGWGGWEMWAIAMAPVLGHAFSPFLGFRGGKAVAAAFGVWIGLTLWVIPLLSIIFLGFWFSLQTVSGWAVILTLASIGGFLLLTNPDPLLLAVVAGQLALMAYTHRHDLKKRPSLALLWWVRRLRSST